MKNYKLIKNIGYKNESVEYFDRLTAKRIIRLKELYSYVLLSYSDFLKCYLPFDFKTTNEQKTIYENNLNYYCERY